MAKKFAQIMLNVMIFTNLTACSIVSQSISQVTAQTNIKPSNKYLTPTTSMVVRAKLNEIDSKYIASANVGDVGVINISDQKINVHVLDIYNAANGRLCKKTMVDASNNFPAQQLAICTVDKDNWELTRSIVSSVTF